MASNPSRSALCQTDLIYVGKNSRAAVVLINDAILRLERNTTMRLIDVVPNTEKHSPGVDFRHVQFLQSPLAFLAVNTPHDVNGPSDGIEFSIRIDDAKAKCFYPLQPAPTFPDPRRLLCHRCR